ncbi:MAG: divergent polysaccharide deacetylase family protein [Geminicoccaceae bacterium]|jgi:polysaccharide deacetylase 2 family uncharacterized protein YibQ
MMPLPARLLPPAFLPAVDWRSPRLPLVVGAAMLGGSLLVASASLLTGHEAPYRHVGLPSVQGPLAEARRPRPPALFGLASPAVLPPLSSLPSPDPEAPRLEVDPDLVETIDGLTLPRIAADGRQARMLYARGADPTAVPAASPIEIAILVTDLGLDAERLTQSVALPPAIGLAHTPYAAHLPSWQRHARWHGHEVLLELPLQAADHPTSDFGPWALDPSKPPPELIAGTRRVASRGEAYLGLVAASGAFAAAPERFTPVAAELAARGLALIELGEPLLAATAAANGVAYARASGPLDAVPDAAAIDAALARLEATARRDGRALAYAQPYPLTFDRLWHWAQGLEAKGIRLVPVSRFLAEP